jgi:hypothetical protein
MKDTIDDTDYIIDWLTLIIIILMSPEFSS